MLILNIEVAFREGSWLKSPWFPGNLSCFSSKPRAPWRPQSWSSCSQIPLGGLGEWSCACPILLGSPSLTFLLWSQGPSLEQLSQRIGWAFQRLPLPYNAAQWHVRCWNGLQMLAWHHHLQGWIVPRRWHSRLEADVESSDWLDRGPAIDNVPNSEYCMDVRDFSTDGFEQASIEEVGKRSYVANGGLEVLQMHIQNRAEKRYTHPWQFRTFNGCVNETSYAWWALHDARLLIELEACEKRRSGWDWLT